MAKQKSHRRAFRESIREPLQSIKHDSTRKQYIRHTELFAQWAYDYGCRSRDDCTVDIVQSYCDYLCSSGYSASTIHAVIAAVCKSLNIRMSEVKKPLRITSENKRGRTFNAAQNRSDNDVNNPRWHKLVTIAGCCGLRRDELRRLKSEHFIPGGVIDEFDYLHIKGKGGKETYQRLLYRSDEEREYVRLCFQPENCEENGGIWHGDEFDGNSINLHSIRAQNAQRAYKYYCARIESEPGYREQMLAECRRQWNTLNHNADGKPRYLPPNRYEGYYYLRGRCRQFAIQHGLDCEFRRDAVLTVSLFHLAHNRLGVTVDNYLLAI